MNPFFGIVSRKSASELSWNQQDIIWLVLRVHFMFGEACPQGRAALQILKNNSVSLSERLASSLATSLIVFWYWSRTDQVIWISPLLTEGFIGAFPAGSSSLVPTTLKEVNSCERKKSTVSFASEGLPPPQLMISSDIAPDKKYLIYTQQSEGFISLKRFK